MSDLAEFLLARIAEDEAVALEPFAPSNAHPYGETSLPEISPDQWEHEINGYLGGPWGTHSSRWSPARVLAECATKRRIVRQIELAENAYVEGDYGLGVEVALDRVAELLAQTYADHPDFRQEWAR